MRRNQRSPEAGAYHKWYSTARWQKLRWATLVRDLFTCQMPGCGRLLGNTSQLVADHVEPHRGNPEKFWHGELRTVCKLCHDAEVQRIEKGGRPRQQVGADGWPIEPSTAPCHRQALQQAKQQRAQKHQDGENRPPRATAEGGG